MSVGMSRTGCRPIKDLKIDQSMNAKSKSLRSQLALLTILDPPGYECDHPGTTATTRVRLRPPGYDCDHPGTTATTRVRLRPPGYDCGPPAYDCDPTFDCEPRYE